MTGASRLRSSTRALRHRDFRLFFFGQIVSLVGTWMQTVAQSWLVYRLTGSSALLGAVNFAGQIPIFLLSTAGGIAADRYSRRHIIIATQAISMALAAILAALTLGGVVEVWHLFVLAALLGIVNAFDIPARQSFLVEMTSRDDLINAIALNSSAFNGARIAGPAVAGVLVAAVGEGWCFFANAVSYLAVLAGLLLMTTPARRPAAAAQSALRHAVEGFRFVSTTAPIRALLLLVGLISVAGTPYSALMPIFADRVLGSGATGLGVLMGANGAGALTGALLLAGRETVRGLGRWISLATGMFSLALLGFAMSASFALSAALLFVMGFGAMIQMGASNTLIQSMTPDHLRGRTLAAYSMMLMGMAPIGALVSGLLAERFGAPLTVGVGAVACAVGSGLFAMVLPSLRQEARALIDAQSTVPPEVS